MSGQKQLKFVQYFNRVLLPQGELLRKAKVFGRSKDVNSEITGSCDPNPFLNMFTYKFEFPDGEIKEYSANVIAENVHSQEDEDSNSIQILDAIDHRKEINAVDKAGTRLHVKSRKQRFLHTTSGWSLLILWKNGE